MVDPNDPFAGLGGDAGDRTNVLKPRPGGARAPLPQGAPSAPTVVPSYAPPPPPAPAAPVEALRFGGGINALERAAASLLTLVHGLRNSVSHPDPLGLRRRVAEEIRSFEARARADGVRQEEIFAAHYVLCTLLDETAMATPWGASSGWSAQSLLVQFHNEAWGGEKVFQLLEKLLQDPRNNLNLLELVYVVLALGFEGKYHVLPDGRNQLEALRERLYQTLRTVRGEFERELSVHWRGAPVKRNPLSRYVPLWALGALAASLLLGLFLILRASLNAEAEPVYANLHGLGENLSALVTRPLAPPPPVAVAAVAPAPPPPAPTPPRLKGFLEDEIRQGLVAVDDRDDRSVITIRGDGLFASGAATVKDAYLPVLGRIATELKRVPGEVLVTGHSDNKPISNLRFPSNWKLSQVRAESVLELLARDTGQPLRFTAEGKADTEPVASNDTNEGRAQNRRVEITLFAPGVR